MPLVLKMVATIPLLLVMLISITVIMMVVIRTISYDNNIGRWR
jgi:hypothetical protein